MALPMTILTTHICLHLQMSCRYTLDVLVAGEDAPFNKKRHLAETCLIVFGSLAVALAFPTGAEKIFAVTGRLSVGAELLNAAMPLSCHLELGKMALCGIHYAQLAIKPAGLRCPVDN